MTHDPLCPYRPEKWHGWMQCDKEIPCRCGFIAKVRADERNKIFTSLDKLADLGHTDDCRDLTCGGCVNV